MTKTVLFIILLTISYFVNAGSIIVQNTNDAGTGSLRDAITIANEGDTIRFNSSLIAMGSDTIKLASELYLNKGLVLKGLYNTTDTLFISGEDSVGIFNINLDSASNKTLIIDSFFLIKGYNTSGGGINGRGIDFFLIDNSIIKNCRAFAASGGGVSLSSCKKITFLNSIISNNISSSSGGGIILFSSDSLVVNNLILSNNQCSTGIGGGITCFSNITSTIKNSSIINNIAKSGGGGIYTNGILKITNTTIVKNKVISSGSGGGIASISSNSSLTIINSTITNNTIFSGTGDGIASLSSSITIKGSIVAFNGINNIGNTSSPTINSLGYNIFSDISIMGAIASDYFGVTPIQLNLDTLKNNGGSTLTLKPLCGSIAINAGDPVDLNDAQNMSIINIRDIGATESNENPLTRDTLTVITCGYNYVWLTTGLTYTESGFYSDTVSCDSIKTLNLKYPIYRDTLSTVTICFNDSVLLFGEWRKTAGFYVDSNLNIDGCDSLIIQELIVKPIYNTTLFSIICEGDSVLFAGSYLKTQGIYYDSLVSILGCDSITKLNLTISKDTTVIYDSIFSGGTYNSGGGNSYSNAGIYYEFSISQYGCDSITEINLHFRQDTLCTGTIQIDSIGINYYRLSFKDSNISIIDTVRWEVSFGGNTNFYYGDSVLVNFIDSGVHFITMEYTEDILGGSPVCRIEDSIYMPFTYINQLLPVIDTIVDTNCYFLQSPSGITYTSSGIYYDTILSLDSVYVLDYYIKQKYQNFIFDTVCGSYISTNGTIYTTSGAYEELYETQTYCYWDSLWLEITPGTGGAYFYFNQNTPSIIELIDSSYGTDLSYKWSWGDGTYDSAISTPSHTYITHGAYEVCLELTDTINGCKYYYCDSLNIDSNGIMRSSFILNVVKYSNTVGVNTNNIENVVKTYPNPAQNELYIESNFMLNSVSVYSIEGSLVEFKKLSNKLEIINTSSLNKGVYFFKIKTQEGGIVTKRIVISR